MPLNRMTLHVHTTLIRLYSMVRVKFSQSTYTKGQYMALRRGAHVHILCYILQ